MYIGKWVWELGFCLGEITRWGIDHLRSPILGYMQTQTIVNMESGTMVDGNGIGLREEFDFNGRGLKLTHS